jgi:hypothetical protein
MPYATPALITSAGAQGNVAVAPVTPARDTSAATLLVAIVTDGSGSVPAPVGVPTDNKGNTWVPVSAGYGPTGPRGCIYYAASPLVVGSGHTVTVSGSNYSAVAMLAFSGVRASAPLDQQNGVFVSGGTSSIAPGSVTPTQPNEVLVYGLFAGFNEPVTVNVGTLVDHMPLVGAVAWGVASAYEIQTAATARNPLLVHGAWHRHRSRNRYLAAAEIQACIPFDATKPTTAQTRQAAVDSARNNFAAVVDAMVGFGVVPGWTYSQTSGGSTGEH